jgi:hypothetical protein
MAVTVNGSATINNFAGGTTVGSGVPITFAYTAPSGTVGLVMIEVSGSGTPTVPTAFSYNAVAASLIPNTFSISAASVQTSIWYLPSPPTGSADTVSINYTQAITGGGVVILVPLLGVSPTTPFQTTTSANISSDSTGTTAVSSVTPPAATANDLYIGSVVFELGNAATMSVNGGTQLTNTSSRGSLLAGTSSLPGNGGSLGWTSTADNPWAMAAVAFLAPTSGGNTAPIAWIT